VSGRNVGRGGLNTSVDSSFRITVVFISLAGWSALTSSARTPPLPNTTSMSPGWHAVIIRSSGTIPAGRGLRVHHLLRAQVPESRLRPPDQVTPRRRREQSLPTNDTAGRTVPCLMALEAARTFTTDGGAVRSCKAVEAPPFEVLWYPPTGTARLLQALLVGMVAFIPLPPGCVRALPDGHLTRLHHEDDLRWRRNLHLCR
jgi:hypothetical protein